MLKQARAREDLRKKMGCTWSGLSALYDVVSSGTEVWVNERCFRIVRQLGEGGFSFVFLVQERPSGHHHLQQEAKDPSVDHHGAFFFPLPTVANLEVKFQLKSYIYCFQNFAAFKIKFKDCLAISVLCNIFAFCFM